MIPPDLCAMVREFGLTVALVIFMLLVIVALLWHSIRKDDRRTKEMQVRDDKRTKEALDREDRLSTRISEVEAIAMDAKNQTIALTTDTLRQLTRSFDHFSRINDKCSELCQVLLLKEESERNK